MMEAVSVRLATADDVVAISRVLIASITELCGADHLNDPDRISAWLSNKTPDAVRAMFASPDSTFYIAERGPEMAGVGCLDSSGYIRLNYVAPGHRFGGVSKALLGTMEAVMVEHGHVVGYLISTVTARRFYRAMGWRDGPGEGAQWDGYPMHKPLRPASR
jgi:predicted GNAT family acetyltransferase